MKKRNLGNRSSTAKINTSPAGGYKAAVQSVNDYVSDLLPHFQSTPFDSRLNGSSAETCIDSLITSRLVKKFVPNNDTTTDLKAVAIMGFKTYEESLRKRMSSYSIGDHPKLLMVRRKLMDMCKSFNIDYTDCELDVGPGETYISSGGFTHLLAKLSDITHWTTTAECLNSTYMLIYYNRALKRIAKQHIGHVPTAQRALLYAKHKNHPTPGFAVFCDLLDTILVIVPGSKGSSVPKNNETDRFINIEPLFPMILQRLVAKGLLRCLKKAGYALDGNFPQGFTGFIGDRQLLHKRMIKSLKYATIDFSNASDSVCLNVIRSLFPQKVVSLLMEFRSTSVMLPGDQFTYGCELFKLSSMGNGFTFEVMTMLLLAAARVYTDDCSVFGDDVIIPNDYACEFLKLTEVLGFRPNNKKTFIKSNFRESCGSFYHDDYGYITSFDFRRCETYNDVIIMHNKVVIILEEHSDHLNESNRVLFEKLREKLVSFAPLCRKGPLPAERNTRLENLGLYFYDTGDVRRKHMRNDDVKNRYKRWVDKLAPLFVDLNLDPMNWILVTGHEKKACGTTRKRTTLVTCLVRLLTLRPVFETVRGDNYLRDHLLLVEVSTGRTIRVGNAILDLKKRRNYKTSVPILDSLLVRNGLVNRQLGQGNS